MGLLEYEYITLNLYPNFRVLVIVSEQLMFNFYWTYTKKMDLKTKILLQKYFVFRPIKRVLDLWGMLEYKYVTLNRHRNYRVLVQW